MSYKAMRREIEEEEVVRVFARACHPPKKPSELSFDALLDELHIDSLSFIDVLLDLEKIFSIRFDETDLLLRNYRTIGDIANKIMEQKQTEAIS